MNDLWLEAEHFSAVSHRYTGTHKLELQSEYITTERSDPIRDLNCVQFSFIFYLVFIKTQNPAMISSVEFLSLHNHV